MALFVGRPADLYFVIPGPPVAQGSKVAGVSKTGKPYMREASDKKLRPWRSVAREAARAALGDAELLTGSIHIEVHFVFDRPQNHYRTNGQLKPWAPYYRASKPDADKLIRALNDALKGVVWHDDAQVALLAVAKIYGSRPETRVTLRPLQKEVVE